jgi:hypothetical protein
MGSHDVRLAMNSGAFCVVSTVSGPALGYAVEISTKLSATMSTSVLGTGLKLKWSSSGTAWRTVA